ncbi:hypothetical protein F4778DRAFT_717592 [Xylariomycetidae sp. FL2044]|nr:hypothetical protein F4778DRAFT_717592 [Xylariomycetidae sp. FL2044]
MSRRPPKSRAASGKAFTSSASASFGAFSTASSGTNLSYLAEPPDFTSISDANVVVALKNLHKKDATTKAKGLDELLAYVQAHPHEQDGGAEEPILEAWVQLYPRISIDNSRRVRELSHALQFELMKSARKRMEKRVPKIVGSWLAGTFDRDRSVARVATEGLSSFLSTPEKVTQFWRRCQSQILEYASDAIRETPETLSDERSTTAEDAQAKYYRVLAGSLALVLNLLQKLNAADHEKCRAAYDSFFDQDKVWSSVAVEDTVPRRLSCQLLCACVEKQPERIHGDLGRISKLFVAEGLKSSQMGSAAYYITALTSLTSQHPTIWTSDYRGKKSSASRLRAFIEKGSQGSAATFWSSLTELLSIIPSSILPQDPENVSNFIKSVLLGVTSREEPRTNAVDAWSTYLSIVRHFIKAAPSPESRLAISRDHVFPLIAHYLHPSPGSSPWSSGCQVPVLIKAYSSTATSPFDDLVKATEVEWTRLKDEFRDRISHSLPGASKEYEKSQKAIADEASRWFVLVGMILNAHEKTAGTDRPIPDVPLSPSLDLLRDALTLLETRRWKPFGAAAALEAALKEAPLLFKSHPAATSDILSYLTRPVIDDQDIFLTSPTAPYIFSSISLLGEITAFQTEFENIWTSSINKLLEDTDKPGALQAITTLITSKQGTTLAQTIPKLQTELVKRCLMCAVGTTSSNWDLFEAAISFNVLTDATLNTLVKELVNRAISPFKQPQPGVLNALSLIAEKRPEIVSKDEEIHLALMTNVLSLCEDHRLPPIPEVFRLKALVDSPSTGNSRIIDLIQRNLNSTDHLSLGTYTLEEQAQQVYKPLREAADTLDVIQKLKDLLPDVKLWNEELSIQFQETPDPSLAIISSLGGACFLPVSESTTTESVPRDRDGCSIPGRMALYTVRLLEPEFGFERLDIRTRASVVVPMLLTAELASDQQAVLSNYKLWATVARDAGQDDAEDLIDSGQKFVNRLAEDPGGWRYGSESDLSSLVHEVLQTLLEGSKSLTPASFYYARALNRILQALAERHGFPSSGEQWLQNLDILKASPSTVLPAVAILSGIGEALSASRTVNTFCNRLVSDIAGADVHQEKTLTTLVLLNTCMELYDVGELPVANNRLVFAVRQISTWLESPEDLDYRFSAEICRCLQRLLPSIKDVYGSYWERAIDFCIYLWTKKVIQSLDCRIPEIHASLRLMSTLQSLDDTNDDLVEILESSAERRSQAMIELLQLPREVDNTPLMIVDTIICRQVEKLPLNHIKDHSDIYGLVASRFSAIQTAAFIFLSKALPAAQEHANVDALVDKKDAQLPDELISLLLDAPTLEDYPNEDILMNLPMAVRSYLLSWCLVFSAFDVASFKVRGDYSEQLKAANLIGPLMELTFDVLGHSAAHPLNLDKAGFTRDQICRYDVQLAEAEVREHNMQWLMIHIFYLVLKYLPNLFKAWYIDCRSKQTKIAVEGWMTKYFSPIIISDLLDNVAEWARNQEPPADDEKDLAVMVSHPAREVLAGYEVDESNASIAIRVPKQYPLEGISVAGVNRVAVNERKWQSWILITQGAITFSGGSIIDGLITFRRNIAGAMKGQSECAICYSIISSDRRMPDKRCQTCRNLFHRTCLYKWFQSSSQNTCPLCRNPIDYLGSDTRGRR